MSADVSGCVFIECHSAGRCRAPDFQITCKRVSNEPRDHTTTYPCERCGAPEPELHEIDGLFICPKCNQETYDTYEIPQDRKPSA